MLDIKKIKENPEAVKAGLRAKEVDCDATVDRILELDEQRRQLIASTEQRKAMQNKVSKEIPLMKKQGKDVAPLFAEMAELKAELAKDDKENSTRELGDFLFSVINAARLYKLNPDNALEMTNQKFIRRFNYVEDHSVKQGKSLKDMTLEEMDKLWDEAKRQE